MKKLYFLLSFIFAGFSMNSQIINIPDPVFKAMLVNQNSYYTGASNQQGYSIVVDTNNDGEIQVSEALQVYGLSVGSPPTMPITSLEGIRSFANLWNLICENSFLTSLNLDGLTHLAQISVGWSINLAELSVNGCLSLAQVDCRGTGIINLNLNGFTTLSYVMCGNSLSLTSLNVSNCPNLIEVECTNCPIVTLDVSDATHIPYVYCDGCSQLNSLFIKNGSSEEYALSFSNCPNLRYICADESQMTDVQNKINGYGYTNCTLNSYCSFTPGGNYFTMQGTSTYDGDSNGCGVSDAIYRDLRIAISGSAVGNVVTNASGNYIFDVAAGTYTVTPSLENPNYFLVSPANFTVTYPGSGSPYVQNFCISPNGTHNDVEVTIIPLTVARPGFDVRYRIIYKNKGTHPASGNVTLGFNDDRMDYITSTPVYTSQTTNLLSWDYVNLLPFEKREVTVTFNLNTPTETPAVNIGDQLDFVAMVYPILGDGTSEDNTNALKQPVVGSMDPNDKTCIEGTLVGTEVIGKYVHYLIRFENTGNYPAQNIVVKDIIDTSKFAINTFMPVASSHPMRTRFSAPNRVEFIFENINLPFDDAHNDGYVAFKIRTTSALVVGSTFSNTASIYFDYNAPIITNTATSTVQALGNQDFEFSDYIGLSPNPAQNRLNIQPKTDIRISTISIYNMLGQLVVVIPSAGELESIDVSNLETGTYIIKINSDKGTANTKFIKN